MRKVKLYNIIPLIEENVYKEVEISNNNVGVVLYDNIAYIKSKNNDDCFVSTTCFFYPSKSERKDRLYSIITRDFCLIVLSFGIAEKYYGEGDMSAMTIFIIWGIFCIIDITRAIIKTFKKNAI